MSLPTSFITIHAEENATRGLNLKSKETEQTPGSNWCHLQTCDWPLFLFLFLFFNQQKNWWWENGRKTRIRSNLTYRRAPQGLCPSPWSLLDLFVFLFHEGYKVSYRIAKGYDQHQENNNFNKQMYLGAWGVMILSISKRLLGHLTR